MKYPDGSYDNDYLIQRRVRHVRAPFRNAAISGKRTAWQRFPRWNTRDYRKFYVSVQRKLRSDGLGSRRPLAEVPQNEDPVSGSAGRDHSDLVCDRRCEGARQNDDPARH